MLSVVLYGRNDNHGYNLHKRAAISFNCIAETLTDPDDEILFVDYNTPVEMPTFPEAIRDTLTKKALARMKVLRLYPHVHERQYGGRSHLKAVEPLARNVALRRSNPRNPWILSTNTDMIFVPRERGRSLTELVAGLPEDFYELPRFELPEALWESLDRHDPGRIIERVGEWGKALHLNEVVGADPWILYDGPGDFQLVRRETLFRIHGFDESMCLGWHVDSNIGRRLWLLNPKVGTLLDRLHGYHCSHTRVETAVHTVARKENNMMRYVYELHDPYIAAQAETWGLPDEAIPSIDLRDGPARMLDSALAKVLPAMELDYYGLGSTRWDDLRYPAAHVLAYLTDYLTVLDPDACIGYIGANPAMLNLLAGAARAMGFRKPIHIAAEAWRICPAVAQSRPHENTALVPWEDIQRLANCAIFDFGLDSGTVPQLRIKQGLPFEWPTQLRAALRAVLTAVEQLSLRDRSAQKSDHSPDRIYLLINTIGNVFERCVAPYVGVLPTVYSSRVRHGNLRKDRAAGVMPGELRRLLNSDYPADPTEDRSYRLGEWIHFSSRVGNSAGFLEGEWSHREYFGRWTDGHVADLILQPNSVPKVPLTGRLVLKTVRESPRNPQLEVEVLVNGSRAARWALTHTGPQAYTFDLPLEVVGSSEPIRITLRITNPRSPMQFGTALDRRQLGIMVRAFRLTTRSSRFRHRPYWPRFHGLWDDLRNPDLWMRMLRQPPKSRADLARYLKRFLG